MAYFEHPDITEGAISIGDGHCEIVDGVVGVPERIGETQGWHRLSDAEVKEHEAFLRERAAAKQKRDTEAAAAREKQVKAGSKDSANVQTGERSSVKRTGR